MAFRYHLVLLTMSVCTWWGAVADAALPAPQKDQTIAIIGNGLGERAQYYGAFETQWHLRFPDRQLTIRNMCYPGDTAGFRPRAGRTTQWAFPGAEKFSPKLQSHFGEGHYPSPDEWLDMIKADVIVAFFGFNESFEGPQGVANYTQDLTAFIEHTLTQRYNGESPPKLVLVSPIAFEDLSASHDLPNGKTENQNLELYTEAMRKAASGFESRGVSFVDLFHPTLEWFKGAKRAPFTINGAHLSEAGYLRLAPVLLDAIYGPGATASNVDAHKLRRMVKEKNWFWLNDYRMVNGVHVYGRRYNPFGAENYPQEIQKIRQMTLLRDQGIWDIAQGRAAEVAIDDSRTRPLDPVETNYKLPIKYLGRDEAMKNFRLPPGYAIEMFASETEFPDLRNPVQMTFDNKGRLWVAVMPSYPHYRPGDPLPNDKLLIFEDTDGDGRADRQKVFADGLHLPIGFEITAEGVYVTQQPNLVLLTDTDGDDRADTSRIILGGFDSHDTHHAISAFVADAGGAIYMHEGRFLHSQVESPYGPVRCNDGGVFRFDPKNWRIERFSQADYSNPWGSAFDQWGQVFMSDASPGENWWLLPLSLKMPYGKEVNKYAQFTTHKVRPTSGTEFIYSRHFPEEVQGDFLVNNTIGFLGTKQHTMREDGAGYTGDLRYDLVQSSDPNYRPVDMEFAPDGSLYIVDWHNALIGHMQHSARDPNRDHDHGRIYRVTYPSRPLVVPAKVAGEPVAALLEHLKAYEYRTRYRARRELQSRPAKEALPAVRAWVNALDRKDADYERHLLEGLWATWAQNQVDEDLLEQCLTAQAHQVRAAAVEVVRHYGDRLDSRASLLLRAAGDEHPRVRLEALVAATWLENADGARVVLETLKKPIDPWMTIPVETALANYRPLIDELNSAGKLQLADNPGAQQFLAGKFKFAKPTPPVVEAPHDALKARGFDKVEFGLFDQGKLIFSRDAHCATCHQPDGKGLPNVYPPLAGSEWAQGDPERLIKIALVGLWGDLTVHGHTYKMQTTPPMIGFAGMLSDTELAAVLTYVRNSFGNNARPIYPDQVARVREKLKGRTQFFLVDEILKEHPLREEELQENRNASPKGKNVKRAG